MRLQTLHLVTLIICALVAGVFTDDEQQGPPEPGKLELTHEAQINEPQPDDPPEPSTEPKFTETQSPQGPPEPSTRPHFESQASANLTVQGPPEPSTRPHFEVVQNATSVQTSAQLQQGPPEPATGQSHFTAPDLIVRPIPSQQGPPEPSTRPHFSNSSASGSQGPPEPSTRPHFEAPTSQGPPEPSTRPHFSEPAVSSQGPPEPSTRPHFSGSSNQGSQGPPEPSTRPHFSGSSNQGPPEPSTRPHFSEPANQGPPEPSTRPHFTEPQSPSKPPVTKPKARPRPLFSSYYSGPTIVRPVTQAPPQPSRYPVYNPRDRYQVIPEPRFTETPHSDIPNILGPKVTVRGIYGRPYTQQVWRCDIPANNCFLKSKHNFVPFEQQYNFEQTRTALVLDVGRAARKRHELTRRPNPVYAYNAGRLETTGYFVPDFADACISFSYYWNGLGRKHMHILQRNQEDVCIYSAETDPANRQNPGTPLNQWHDIQLQVDLKYGPAKFWIEYQFDLGNKKETNYYQYNELGYIAVRNFSIGYGTCQNSVAEECDVPTL